MMQASLAKRVRDFGCGELLTIANSGDASLHVYVRTAHERERSVEHQYPSHSIVFTDVGEWRYHASESEACVDQRSVVAGTGRRDYSCAHATGVENECFIVALANDAFADDERRVFAKSVVSLTPEMRFHRRAIEQSIHDPDRLEGLAFSLFEAVARAAARDSREPALDVRMAYAKRLMEDACRTPATVESIANELHLSRFTFSRRFLAYTGTTPHAFIAAVRLKRAQEQLRATSLSVEEIALANGFGSLAHFSNAFRKATAVSPTAFRNLSAK